MTQLSRCDSVKGYSVVVHSDHTAWYSVEAASHEEAKALVEAALSSGDGPKPVATRSATSSKRIEAFEEPMR